MKKYFSNLYNTSRFQLSANNNFLFIGFYKYFYTPKKGTISWVLNEYSKAKKEGFTVIQIGANDGMKHDPIHKFIKRDNWNGVLLEPQKYVFDKFLSKIYKKNKGIITLNAAIGEKDGFAPIYKIGFSNARWATGLTTFDKEVLQSVFKSGHVKRQAEKENIQVPDDPSQQIVEERIIVISPETLLKKYNIQKIDLLQIDTEGFDYEVIKMFDICKTQPGMIVFESAHFTEEVFKECMEHLHKNGYKVKSMGGNTIAMLDPTEQFAEFFK